MDKDYYVDPLEQEKAMQEKREKIETAKQNAAPSAPAATSDIDEDAIRPDMNISGFFSTGKTAKKQSFLKAPAGKTALKFAFLTGIISAIFTAFYLILIFSTGFDLYWFLNWIYAVIIVISVINLVNGLRSRQIQNDAMKKHALVGILGSAFALVPLLAWLFNLIFSFI